MNDIEPYICLFEDCGESRRLFRDRASWLTHMQKGHTVQWSCTVAGHAPCVMGTEKSFEDHMRSVHAGAFTEAQLPWLKKRSQGPSNVIFTSCFLCGHVPLEEDMLKESMLQGISLDREHDYRRVLSDCLAKHIASHLESL